MITKISKFIIISFILIFSLTQISFAKVSASVDRKSIGKGESVVLSISLDDFNQQPDLSPLYKNFTVYDTSTSSKVTVVNGKQTASYVTNITLMPNRDGRVIIPALAIGNERTNPITIQVSKNLTNVEETKYSQVFATGELSSNIGYVNSPIVYTLKIFFATPLVSLQLKPFEIKGVDIRETGHNAKYQKQMNGKLYDVIEQSFLIIPNKTGEIHIPAIILQLNVANGFGQLGYKPVIVSTNNMVLNVKPIPHDVNIDDWLPSTSVELSDDWSTTKDLKVGELVTRTVSIAAEGMLGTDIPKLSFESTDEFNIYAEKPQFKDSEENGKMVGTATYKIGYMPTKEGAATVPPVNVKWYNIKTSKLETASIAAKKFNVKPGFVPAIMPLQQAGAIAQNVSSQVSQDNMWRYTAYIFIILWLVTLTVLVFVLKKRKVIVVDEESFKEQDSVKVGTLSEVKKACSKKDIFALKEAIIAWAKTRYKSQIFSLPDVARFNDDLKDKLQELNRAIYSNEDFSNYKELLELLTKANKKDKKLKKSKDKIKGLYE
ncbi:BatD family protein [Pseudofrancisella aestuarii]|uniref:BatD family protein n=1 Tax=Pseudofrancisella aestuarii TaxID=2670347 RepID=A0ABV9TF43_9GAMM|nr:BatD family protein [Pseudofrancisella aestuarii]